jgi:hypothetical protein
LPAVQDSTVADPQAIAAYERGHGRPIIGCRRTFTSSSPAGTDHEDERFSGVNTMTSARVLQRVTLWLAGWMVAVAIQPALAQEAVVDPPGRVARLSYIDGDVSMAPADSEDWADAVLNRPLTSGDKLALGADGRAELQVGSATIHLDRDSAFSFVELDDDVLQMSVTEGAATIGVRSLGEKETIQIETPNATVFLRHPGEYHLEVDQSGDRTIIKARSGEAEVVGGSKASYLVRANQEGVFTGLENLTSKIDPIAPRTAFESWANDRDRRDERSASARYVSPEVIGYEDLDDDGEWIEEPSYGHVWRPIYVASDWAPYRYGRWGWVSPWGWTWIDDARWGFAPFHYGRWAHLRNRWCWVPGPRHLRPVYAPALVGWVGGPSVSVSLSFGSGVGWYPLAPREIYVPGYRHTPRYVRYVNESNTVIINNTHITNVYGRRDQRWGEQHHDRPGAITVVGRDHFVGGRPIGGNRLHVNERDLRQWRDNVRPPVIAPDRDSVLAGQPRRAPPSGARYFDNPKNGTSDFRAQRQRVLSGDVKRTEQLTRDRGNVVRDRTDPSGGRENGGRDARQNERVEIMRPESPVQSLRQRDESQLLRPRNDSRQRDDSPNVRQRDDSRQRDYPSPTLRQRDDSRQRDDWRRPVESRPAAPQIREQPSRNFRRESPPGKEPRAETRSNTPSYAPRPVERSTQSQGRDNNGSSQARPPRAHSNPKQQDSR